MNQNGSQSVNINQLLDGFIGIPRVHHLVDIIQYWKYLKSSKPELHKLAMVIMAVP